MEEQQLSIDINSFVNFNQKFDEIDIEAVFMSYGARGPRVDLFKLEKSHELSTEIGFILLLGKASCISEHMNYKKLKKEDWIRFYNPPPGCEIYFMKNYKRISVAKFSDFSKSNLLYFKSESCNLSFTKPICFNGSNSSENRNSINELNSSEVQALDPFKGQSILNCYLNDEIPLWELWLIETEESYYLYDFNFGD